MIVSILLVSTLTYLASGHWTDPRCGNRPNEYFVEDKIEDVDGEMIACGRSCTCDTFPECLKKHPNAKTCARNVCECRHRFWRDENGACIARWQCVKKKCFCYKAIKHVERISSDVRLKWSFKRCLLEVRCKDSQKTATYRNYVEGDGTPTEEQKTLTFPASADGIYTARCSGRKLVFGNGDYTLRSIECRDPTEVCACANAIDSVTVTNEVEKQVLVDECQLKITCPTDYQLAVTTADSQSVIRSQTNDVFTFSCGSNGFLFDGSRLQFAECQEPPPCTCTGDSLANITLISDLNLSYLGDGSVSFNEDTCQAEFTCPDDHVLVLRNYVERPDEVDETVNLGDVQRLTAGQDPFVATCNDNGQFIFGDGNSLVKAFQCARVVENCPCTTLEPVVLVPAGTNDKITFDEANCQLNVDCSDAETALASKVNGAPGWFEPGFPSTTSNLDTFNLVCNDPATGPDDVRWSRQDETARLVICR